MSRRPPVAARTPSACRGSLGGSPTTTIMKRAGTPQERALAQMKLKAAATASRSAALFQKSVASASESRPTSKRGKKTKKKKRLYKRPKAWEECWVDVRKKQDAFGQKWKVWPRKAELAVTLLGTCLYVEPETAKASNGWWAPSVLHV